MNPAETKFKKESYLVEGMSCESCERAIQKTVSGLRGVRSAKADLASASLSFEYDPGEVTLDEIKSAIGKLGYRLTDQAPRPGQHAGSDEAIP